MEYALMTESAIELLAKAVIDIVHNTGHIVIWPV